ncbi:hypothetical protein MESS4_590046 [Mesorhizobium sp. STM 4661]|nr:hypothetical protein MESS4_590046 [Mesorhizobium sp. STM 4661]
MGRLLSGPRNFVPYGQSKRRPTRAMFARNLPTVCEGRYIAYLQQTMPMPLRLALTWMQTRTGALSARLAAKFSECREDRSSNHFWRLDGGRCRD